MNLRALRRWNTPNIDALTISSSTYSGQLLPIICSQRSRASMCKGSLTHSLHRSEFIELTLIFRTQMQIEKREKQTHDVCFSLVFYVLNRILLLEQFVGFIARNVQNVHLIALNRYKQTTFVGYASGYLHTRNSAKRVALSGIQPLDGVAIALCYYPNGTVCSNLCRANCSNNIGGKVLKVSPAIGFFVGFYRILVYV